MNKADFMREQLGDLSDDACTRIYDALRKGYASDCGWILVNECEDSVVAHYMESMVREPDEVDRRLDERAA